MYVPRLYFMYDYVGRLQSAVPQFEQKLPLIVTNVCFSRWFPCVCVGRG